MYPILGTVPTAINDIVADSTTLFTAVQVVAVAIVAFGIILWVVKKIRK